MSLTVTDSDGATATTTAAVQVTGLLHISFVDAVITSGKNGKGTPHWSVSATVEAHGADERVIAGATLRGHVEWSENVVLRDRDGWPVHVQHRRVERQTVVGPLTVLGVSAPSSVYHAPANHDPAGNATACR